LNNQFNFSIAKYAALFLLLCSSLSVEAQVWEQVNQSPFRDDHTNSFGFEDKAYVFRGSPTNFGNGDANEVWQYTPATDSWSILTTFPGDARRISIGDDWDGKYYYGFGIGGPDGRLNDLWVFDPVDTSFTELPSCPCPGRSHPSLIAHNDKVFMGGGSSSNGDVKDWWEYDMITQEWIQKPDIPGGVRHHTFHFSSGKYVYVGGGHVFNWNRYDPETEEWTPIDDLPAGRVAGTQFNYNNLGFILAGDNASHSHVPDFETFMYYSPESKEWDYLPPLPNGSRWAPSSFIVGEELFFLAGLSDLVNNDATMWKFDLSMIDCLPPSGLNAVDVDDTSAGLFWMTNTSSDSDTLKWRKVGDTLWNDVVDADIVYQLDNLEVCQEYEFRVVIQCGATSSSSETYVFRTTGCCMNPEITINSITPNSAIVEWPEIAAADEYNIRWRPLETNDWAAAAVNSSPYELTDLDECTRYEFQIESVCSIEENDFSESTIFRTRNCGACLDLEYCEILADFSTNLSFIYKVEINDYLNISGDNDGYANFDGALAEEIIIGESFTFTLEPGFVLAPQPFDLIAWIDFDSNGSFEESEIVIFEESVDLEITRDILIPTSAISGLTRMRIFYGNTSGPCLPEDLLVLGEAEEYCLKLLEKTSVINILDDGASTLEVFPNPFQDKFVLIDNLNAIKSCNVRIVNVAGETVFSFNDYKMGDEFELPSKIEAGLYILVAENDSEITKLKIVKN